MYEAVVLLSETEAELCILGPCCEIRKIHFRSRALNFVVALLMVN